MFLIDCRTEQRKLEHLLLLRLTKKHTRTSTWNMGLLWERIEQLPSAASTAWRTTGSFNINSVSEKEHYEKVSIKLKSTYSRCMCKAPCGLLLPRFLQSDTLQWFYPSPTHPPWFHPLSSQAYTSIAYDVPIPTKLLWFSFAQSKLPFFCCCYCCSSVLPNGVRDKKYIVLHFSALKFSTRFSKSGLAPVNEHTYTYTSYTFFSSTEEKYSMKTPLSLKLRQHGTESGANLFLLPRLYWGGGCGGEWKSENPPEESEKLVFHFLGLSARILGPTSTIDFCVFSSWELNSIDDFFFCLGNRMTWMKTILYRFQDERDESISGVFGSSGLF